MRIALISDIHGNCIALDAALADISRQRIDQIVCLGDVIFNGPQPKQVVERLIELGCPVVMGNTDCFFVDPPASNPKDTEDRIFLDIIQYGLDVLSANHRAFIKAFQPRIEIPLDAENALLAFHGSPNSNRDVILPTTPEAELAMMLFGHQASLMAGGHTHTPMLRRYIDTLLINPGSIGLPFHPRPGQNKEKDVRPPWAEYAVITVDPEPGVEFRRVRFDVGLLLERARTSGMPYYERWAAPWKAD